MMNIVLFNPEIPPEHGQYRAYLRRDRRNAAFD